MVYLNDDEIAVINRGESLHVFNMDNKESKVNIQKLRMSISELEKGGYPHFMLKEIFEQPRTLRDCIRGRVSADGKHVVLSTTRSASSTPTASSSWRAARRGTPR